MNVIVNFDAFLFPADGKIPRIVKLATSSMPELDPQMADSQSSRMPHPELHMDFVAEIGSQSWQYLVSPYSRTRVAFLETHPK